MHIMSLCNLDVDAALGSRSGGAWRAVSLKDGGGIDIGVLHLDTYHWLVPRPCLCCSVGVCVACHSLSGAKSITIITFLQSRALIIIGSYLYHALNLVTTKVIWWARYAVGHTRSYSVSFLWWPRGSFRERVHIPDSVPRILKDRTPDSRIDGWCVLSRSPDSAITDSRVRD